jgi:hypothetical protein
MKYLKNWKILSEELKPSTYLSAADKLSKVGHKKRPEELKKWAYKRSEVESINIAKDLGEYKLKFWSNQQGFKSGWKSVDCYIALSFDKYQFEEDYRYWLKGETSNIYINFSFGVIPINEESDTAISSEFNKQKTGIYWITNIYLHLTENAERTGGETSQNLLTINDIKIPKNKMDLANMIIPKGICDFDNNNNIFFSDRKSAIKFKKTLIDIFEGRIIYNETSEDPGGLKGIIFDEICSEREFTLDDFVRFIKSLNRIRINSLYQD